MSWLTYGGKDPAELLAGVQIHGGNLPDALLKRKNIGDQIAAAIHAAAPELSAWYKQKKADDIANQLMNSQDGNIPRAQVFPGQYASQDVGPYSAGDAITQGAPASVPFTGGDRGFQIQQYLQKQQSAGVTDDLKHALIRANIEKAGRAPVGRGTPYIDTPEGQMTPWQWGQIQRKREATASANDPRALLDRDLTKQYGITSSDLAPILQGQVEASPGGDVSFNSQAGVPIETTKEKILPYVNRAMGLQQYQKAIGGGTPQPVPVATPPAGDAPLPQRDNNLDAAAAANANAIRAEYRAGRMTKKEAAQRLRALGFQ